MLTIKQLPINENVVKYIESYRHLLTPDFSSYANERKRAWIGVEGSLSDNQPFREAPFGYDTMLWKWLHWFCVKNLDFEPELALLHVGGADCSDPEDEPINGPGGECGIKQHRDAGYADYRAIGINLAGEATFGYRCEYIEQDKWTKERNANPEVEYVKMIPGTCVGFNCKNPHFAQVGPNRWCINAWRVSNKRRDDYEQFLNQIRSK